MNDERMTKAMVGQVGLGLVPETIRQSMLHDDEFLSKFDLDSSVESTVHFGEAPKFKAKSLFAAIRRSDSQNTEVPVKCKSGATWTVKISSTDDGIRFPLIFDGEQNIGHLEGSLFLQDREARQYALEQLTTSLALPESDQEVWSSIIAERPFTDEELADFHADIENTPKKFSDRLGSSLQTGETAVDLFVPDDEDYYARLVGPYSDASDLSKHADGGALERASQLFNWNGKAGSHAALVMASHSEFVRILKIGDLNSDDQAELFDHLATRGDPISMLGAIQASLSINSREEIVDKSLIKLARSLIGEVGDADGPKISELSRLFLFVYSEMSRKRILRDASVFYRRMAAFAQAALIQRQFIAEGADPTEFLKWIYESCGPQFYCQCLVDMRTDPRWHPDLAHESQLKQEFIGRLLGSAESNREILADTELGRLLLPGSDADDGIHALAQFPKPYFPGPLEGAMPPSQKIPKDLLDIIDEQLSGPEIGASSFVAAINVANVFLVEPELAERISDLLKKAKYRLHSSSDADELSAILLGLGKIAAITRNEALSEDVRILVRRYWRDEALDMSANEAYRSLLFAAAAHSEREKWCIFVGRAVDDLAFSSLTEQRAQSLRVFLRFISNVEPSLWATIGAAHDSISFVLA